MARIAAEKFVAPYPRQRHGYRAPGLPAHQVGGYRRGVGKRLVEMARQLPYHRADVRGDRHLEMLRAEVFRRSAGARCFVETRIFPAEAGGKSLDPLAGMLGHERKQAGGIHAARKQQPQRHIADQLFLHAFGEQAADVLQVKFLGLARQVRRLQLPIFLNAYRAAAEDQQRGRLQLVHALIYGQRGGDVEVGKIIVQRGGVQVPAKPGHQPKGLKLRSEIELVPGESVVERLYPELVARQQQLAGPAVPEREGEHASQQFREALSVFFVEVNQHFGVGIGSESVSRGLKLAAQFAEVVDLTVENYGDGSVLVGDGLRPRGQVYDLQPAHTQRNLFALGEETVLVRTPVLQRQCHAAQQRVRAQPGEAADAAHQSSLRSCPASSR